MLELAEKDRKRHNALFTKACVLIEGETFSIENADPPPVTDEVRGKLQ